ncbi:MAG TPA: RDD family protein [Candidatus Methylomirabilis sp.]|nr:RDD family protein [Candidatus Methylomirabilis sp.]
MTPDMSPPGFLLRLGAISYDFLLLLALLLLMSFPYAFVTGGHRPGQVAYSLYQTYLFAIWFLYFAWFWVHGGQTLGMRTWRIKLVCADGGPVTWVIASKRFGFALVSLLCLGLGFFWILYDRDKRAWHDRWSGTKLVRVPKN